MKCRCCVVPQLINLSINCTNTDLWNISLDTKPLAKSRMQLEAYLSDYYVIDFSAYFAIDCVIDDWSC
jgi:hypothetical protein